LGGDFEAKASNEGGKALFSIQNQGGRTGISKVEVEIRAILGCGPKDRWTVSETREEKEQRSQEKMEVEDFRESDQNLLKVRFYTVKLEGLGHIGR